MPIDDAVKIIDEAYAVVRSLRTERYASDQRYRERIAEAEALATRLQDEAEKNYRVKLPNRLERRRTEVLSLLRQGRTTKQIAEELATYPTQIDNDVHHLTRLGLYPVPLQNPDDEETRRRNRVLRVWQFTTVRVPADVTKYLDLPEKVILSDLRWLTDHGYAGTTSTPSPPPGPNHEDPPRSDPTDRTATPPRPQPQTPPTPAPTLPPTRPRAPHVATSAELRTELSLRSPSPSGTYSLTTSTHGRHSHTALVNSEGDGQTLPDETGHTHRVSKFCIMSSNRHVHDFRLPQP